MTTDEPDQPVDPLSPEDDARVRRLLADARATGPMPPEVAARMDDTLVGLVATRAASGPPADAPTAPVPADNVVPIRRTRRHRVVALVGTAAAVTLIGLGIGTFFTDDDPVAQDSAGEPVSRGDEAELDAAEPTEDARLGEASPSPEVAPSEVQTLITDQQAHLVRSRHFAADLKDVQAGVLPSSATADYGRTMLTAPTGFVCESAPWGRGVLVGIRYDGIPAVVAFRAPMGRSQVAEVLQCGTAEVLRSTTIPTTD